MNPKPLDAGLAERLFAIWYDKRNFSQPLRLRECSSNVQAAWKDVAGEVRKIVKSTKEGK